MVSSHFANSESQKINIAETANFGKKTFCDVHNYFFASYMLPVTLNFSCDDEKAVEILKLMIVLSQNDAELYENFNLRPICTLYYENLHCIILFHCFLLNW